MNLIRAFLNSHANKGYNELSAKEKDMYAIYLASRGRVEGRIKEYVLQKRSSFTGPRLVMLMEELQDMFTGFEAEYRKTTKYAITYVAQSFYHSALVDLAENPNEVVGKLNKNTLNLMLEDNYTHVAGATKQMSKAAISNLRRISAQVMREASMTGETQIAVSKRLFYENGGEKFIFAAKDGRKWNPDAYFEMLSRTMLHNNAREAYLQGCSDEKSDIVAISASGNPCPACARWETRLLSISGTGKYPSLESARSSGLFHPNCTHRIIAVDPVIAEDDFDSKGRPKAGINSRGKEQKDDKEAWREYRKKGSLKSPKTQKMEKIKPKGWKSDNLKYPDNLNDLEKTIVKGKNEHVAVFDSETNRKIWVDEGTHTGITGIPAMRVRNNIVTHNHPNGTSFSPEDIYTAMVKDAQELRVVGSKYTYSLKGRWNDPQTFDNFTKEWYNLRDEMTNKYWTKKISHKNLNILSSHKTNEILAKKYGVEYVRQRRK